jgi:hypothetical protein
MQFARQYDSRFNLEWPTVQAQLSCMAQYIDMTDQEIGPLILQTHGKEISATRHLETAVI